MVIPEADDWRTEAWAMIRIRSDLEFLILTKRIDRFEDGKVQCKYLHFSVGVLNADLADEHG